MLAANPRPPLYAKMDTPYTPTLLNELSDSDAIAPPLTGINPAVYRSAMDPLAPCIHYDLPYSHIPQNPLPHPSVNRAFLRVIS